MNSVKKPCVLCGAECEGQPRVKDPKGRYYCKACYDTTAAERAAARRGGPVADGVEEAADGLSNLAELAAAASAAPAMAAEQIPCPSCAAILPAGSVFCVSCGHDLRSGKRASVTVVKAPKAPASGGRTSGGRGAASLGWALGLPAGVPLLIAIATVASDGAATVLRRAVIADPTLASGSLTAPLAVALIGAMIVGWIWSYLGPWWYRTRVGWSGGTADPTAARSGYFAATLPYLACSLAAVLLLVAGQPGLAQSASYATYGASMLGCVWLFLLAKDAFGAKPLRAGLLLIGLPLVFYIGVAIIAFVIVMSSLELLERAGIDPNAPKASETLLTHDATPSHPIRFRHPSNWFPDHQPAQDGMFAVTIAGPDGSSVALTISDEEVEFAAWETIVLDAYRSRGFSVTPDMPIGMMGGKPARGRASLVRADRGEQLARLAVIRITNTRWLLVESLTPNPDLTRSKAAVDEIVGSISLPPK